jgi:hypothetical protein
LLVLFEVPAGGLHLALLCVACEGLDIVLYVVVVDWYSMSCHARPCNVLAMIIYVPKYALMMHACDAGAVVQ